MKTIWFFLFTICQVFCQENGVCSIDSLGILTLWPEEIVIPTGSSAIFYCFLESHPCGIERLSNIMWLVNRSLLKEQNDHVSIVDADSEVIGSLEFVNVPATYDMTELQCMANIPSTANIIHSNIAELIVLEDVPVVDDLIVSVQGSVFSLNWTVSPSTPSTTFCAEMSKSSQGNNIIIDTEFDIRATAHEFEIPSRSYCNHFFFYVTPMNEFHTGTRRETSYTQDVDIPSVEETTYSSEETEFRIFNVTLMMSDPVCSVEVNIVDTEGQRVSMEGSDLNITGTNITISHLKYLTSDLYNITVVAQNVAGSGPSSNQLDLRKSTTSDVRSYTTTTGPTVSDATATSISRVVSTLVTSILLTVTIVATAIVVAVTIAAPLKRMLVIVRERAKVNTTQQSDPSSGSGIDLVRTERTLPADNDNLKKEK